MKKRNNIVYWIATAWLSLGMLSTGLVQVLQVEENIQPIRALGYPAYFIVLLGICKILGVAAVLLPRIPLVKEWAYAGFFFAMSGAAISHLVSGSPLSEIFPSLLLLALTILSWYFRPSTRQLNAVIA
jgi:DoxX-like family